MNKCIRFSKFVSLQFLSARAGLDVPVRSVSTLPKSRPVSVPFVLFLMYSQLRSVFYNWVFYYSYIYSLVADCRTQDCSQPWVLIQISIRVPSISRAYLKQNGMKC